jgi:predicted Zn-dependent protease
MKQQIEITDALEWWIKDNPELKRILKELVKHHKGDLLLGEKIRDIVNNIKDELVQVITLRDGVDEIDVTIVESDEVGAWALPGGFVILTDSFYRMCENDDELASILGHEIAHIVQGHVNNPMEERLQDQYTEAVHNLGLDVGMAFTDEYASISAEGMVNMVTKQKELEADKFGILYTTLAGYEMYL